MKAFAITCLALGIGLAGCGGESAVPDVARSYLVAGGETASHQITACLTDGQTLRIESPYIEGGFLRGIVVMSPEEVAAKFGDLDGIAVRAEANAAIDQVQGVVLPEGALLSKAAAGILEQVERC